MVLKPSVVQIGDKQIPLAELPKEQREKLIQNLTVRAYQAIGYQKEKVGSGK